MGSHLGPVVVCTTNLPAHRGEHGRLWALEHLISAVALQASGRDEADQRHDPNTRLLRLHALRREIRSCEALLSRLRGERDDLIQALVRHDGITEREAAAAAGVAPSYAHRAAVHGADARRRRREET